MRNSKTLLLASLLGASCLGFVPGASAQEVTFDRLVNSDSEPQNWLTTYGNYAGWSYSRLDQINTENAADLRLVYLRSIGGETSGQDLESRPLVADGFMYLFNGISEVLKLDLTGGDSAELVWRNNPAAASGGKMGSLALLNASVYNATRDMRLLRLDMETGETIWDVSTRAPENPYADEWNSTAPVAVNNSIITTGAGSALRSWMAAWDADTGELQWRWLAVPGPGEPGHETWEDDHDAWLTGGAGIWTAPTYDPETNLLFVGTGEPQPWTDPEFRPGDNLYSMSTVAVNATTGELVWYFQELPDESWDYDTVNMRMLHQADFGGEVRAAVSNFSRSGMYYTLDLVTGEFLTGGPYVDVTWTAGLDPKTGKPVEYDPNVPVQSYANNSSMRPGDPTSNQNVCPRHGAMPTWWPPTYDPARGMAWVQAVTGCESQFMAESLDTTLDHWREDPYGLAAGAGVAITNEDPSLTRGLIIGVDAITGEVAQRIETEYWTGSGLLGTAGDLIFTGHSDGRFSAYDKDTLEELWHFNTGTIIGAPPITFEVGGEQFVAVLLGGGWVRVPHPDIRDYTKAPMLAVFAL
ncbi:MAG: PQQ-binding-like beta-propeller repeat protein [Bauldia sp.]|nr:PQQ-binding-like beta-propeller repeat protein [Bauldia sp.]